MGAKKRLAGLGEYSFLICIAVGIVLILVVIYVQDSTRNTPKYKHRKYDFISRYLEWESKLKDGLEDKVNHEGEIGKSMTAHNLFPDLDDEITPPNPVIVARPASASSEEKESKVKSLNEYTDIFPLPFNNVLVDYHGCPDSKWSHPVQTMDNILSEKNLAQIITNGEELEEILVEEMEWQRGPGLLELVDPLLYCLVDDVTVFNVTEECEFETPFINPFQSYSRKFQLLPTEFYFHPIFEKVKAISYINNLDPRRYENLYRLIEMIIAQAVPLFEKVLTNLINCWDGYLPVSLRGRRLQMIVGMTSIHLTPDSPKYNGSDWDVAGLINERIVASAIYYYDVDNVFESLCVSCHHVSFRSRFGDSQDQGWILPVASINRMVVFPNMYQHKIEPFWLDDPKNPGHRKFISLFLVDPNVRILSTTNVAPQQQSWYPISESEAGEKFHGSGYPYNISDTMTLDWAKYYRDQAKEERRNLKKDILYVPSLSRSKWKSIFDKK